MFITAGITLLVIDCIPAPAAGATRLKTAPPSEDATAAPATSVSEFGTSRIVALIPHGSAAIQSDNVVNIGVFLVGFGNQFVPLGVYLPIKVLDILSWIIRTILKKLTSPALPQALVHPLPESMND